MAKGPQKNQKNAKKQQKKKRKNRRKKTKIKPNSIKSNIFSYTLIYFDIF